MKWIEGVFWLMLTSSLLAAQNEIPIGSWRTHFSYRDASQVAITGPGVYCAGLNSLFFVDSQDQSLKRISKIDGLSDSGISSIGYCSNLNILVIAYSNGNIDLLEQNQVFNIRTIFESRVDGSKAVNHILFNNNRAYLATDFGVVVIDLLKTEVMEAYQHIGANGETISINFGAVYQDTLFFATEQGIIGGSLDPATNLQDFRNWKRSNPDGFTDHPVSTIASNETQLLATIDKLGIYRYRGSGWDKLDYDPVQSFYYAESGSPLLITEGDKILFVAENDKIEQEAHPTFPRPRAASLRNNSVWIADSLNGLTTNSMGDYTSLFPDGPFSDSILSVHYQGEAIIGLPPGYDQLRKPLGTKLGFYFFENGEWSNFNDSGLPGTHFFPSTRDLVDIAYQHANNKYYIASFGQGIIEWDPQGEIHILDHTTPGSTLVNIPGSEDVWISSVNADVQGMVWSTNFGNPRPIHRYDPQSQSWTAYESNFQAGRYPLALQIAGNGDLWLRLDPLQGGGIMVLNPDSDQQRHLTNIDGEGGLPGRKINDLQIDLDGQVWMGMDNGVFYYPLPFDILSRQDVNARPVLIDGRPLLADEPVNCLAVDGGNRKWIGTENGIWLVSASGDQVINTFNVNNSPLPSDVILSIAVNHQNGEVFVVTALGMVSFRGTATAGDNSQKETVKIFPNPVDRDFNGLVGISGLVQNAIVKISDVRGALIKEIKAAGGTAVWDINDYQGRRVETGVYLVFSSSEDGNETFVGKIAVIN